MSTPVEQIAEKLKRANEHVMQLEEELDAFQNDASYGPISNDAAEQARAFRGFWETRVVPPRFPVLAGEVLQQLRSSLTYLHVALIVRDGNVPDTRSQFPIFSTKPTEPQDIARYDAQLRGITRPQVVAAIERHQPHAQQTRFEGKTWLSLLGGMSNIDKHEAIVLSIAVVDAPLLRAYVAFPQFGRDPNPQPVCTVLRQFAAGVREIIGELEPFLI